VKLVFSERETKFIEGLKHKYNVFMEELLDFYDFLRKG
jgi:hypothetical protein